MMKLDLGDVVLPDKMTMRVDYRQDSIALTCGLYEGFLAKGRPGRDAMAVYLHLIYAFRRQQTNRPWATDEYLKKGIGIGDNRLTKAKALLKTMELIAYSRERGQTGRLGKVFIELLLQANPGPRTKPAPVEPEAQADPWFEDRGAEDDEEAPVDFEEKKSPQKKLFSLYYALHKRRCGTFPRFTRADAVVFDADMKLHGLEKMTAYIEWLFEHPPARMTFGIRGMGIHTFLPEAIKAITEQEGRLRLLKTCSACGKDSDTSGLDCPKCGQPDAYRKGAERAAL